MLPLMNLLTPTYGHNHVVDILLFTLPISLLLSIKDARYVIVAGATLVGIVGSFSRAAIFLIACILMAFLFLAKKQLHGIHKKALGIASIIMIGFAVLAVLIDAEAEAMGLPVGVRELVVDSSSEGDGVGDKSAILSDFEPR